MDEAAVPIQAEWYRRRVAEHLGDRLDDQYRLWFIDNAMHTTPVVQPDDPRPVRTTRVVSYLGVLHQGLRDLVDWVEHGVAPPESTPFEVAAGQVVVPATAAERKGVQPVPTLTVDGADRIEVAVGRAGDLRRPGGHAAACGRDRGGGVRLRRLGRVPRAPPSDARWRRPADIGLVHDDACLRRGRYVLSQRCASRHIGKAIGIRSTPASRTSPTFGSSSTNTPRPAMTVPEPERPRQGSSAAR